MNVCRPLLVTVNLERKKAKCIRIITNRKKKKNLQNVKIYDNASESKHHVSESLAAAAVAGRNTELTVGKDAIIKVTHFQFDLSIQLHEA